MNREIKFRTWDKHNQKMVYPYIHGHGFTSGKIIDRYDENELMQYTGLKDKNGKEIYEGDILKIDDSAIAEVIWFRGGFMLKLKGYFGYRNIEYFDGDSEKHKIIGNKFENPELLENKSQGDENEKKLGQSK